MIVKTKKQMDAEKKAAEQQKTIAEETSKVAENEEDTNVTEMAA